VAEGRRALSQNPVLSKMDELKHLLTYIVNLRLYKHIFQTRSFDPLQLLESLFLNANLLIHIGEERGDLLLLIVICGYWDSDLAKSIFG
jgi:hypothetical protein